MVKSKPMNEVGVRSEAPEIKRGAEFIAHDRKPVTIIGQYRSIIAPSKGTPLKGAPEDFAVIVLEDGTEVFIEPMDSPRALRSPKERQQFNGKKVRVRGTAYRTMPSQGESLVAPCIDSVYLITECK
jgi:hypothetical protein